MGTIADGDIRQGPSAGRHGLGRTCRPHPLAGRASRIQQPAT